MPDTIRIGTRESELALWQANQVRSLLETNGHSAELVLIKSEGDINLTTPLYEMGVQGIFTRTLDIALLENRIDVAVHSMKDVPVVLPKGLNQAAVLKRGNYKDLLVLKDPSQLQSDSLAIGMKDNLPASFYQAPVIATSSIRRKAQWLHRYPNSTIEILRGNVNTRLRKLQESQWHGAIFAAAGLERIGLRPSHAQELDWMLPAPAQGAIMVVARLDDTKALTACASFHDESTGLCVKAERDFLKTLLGGCSTPISALVTQKGDELVLEGNILTPDGKEKIEVVRSAPVAKSYSLGVDAAFEILDNGGDKLMEVIRRKNSEG